MTENAADELYRLVASDGTPMYEGTHDNEDDAILHRASLVETYGDGLTVVKYERVED